MILVRDLDTACLGAVLKTALDAVVVMRLDGTIAGWNDVAKRTFGWSFEEARGERMSAMIIPHRFRDAHERGLKHYLATGEGPVLDRRIEIEALHREGHELPVELSITRTSQFGEPVFLGFLRDISERRDAAAGDTIKQILTLATASIGGAIALFDDKDEAGIQFGMVAGWVDAGLVLLAVSVVFGLMAMGAKAGQLGSDKIAAPSTYAFALRTMTMGQMLFYGLGIAMLVVAAT